MGVLHVTRKSGSKDEPVSARSPLAPPRTTPSPAPVRAARPHVRERQHRHTGAGTGDPDSVPRGTRQSRRTTEDLGVKPPTVAGQPSRPNPTANLAGVPEGSLYRARKHLAPAPSYR